MVDDSIVVRRLLAGVIDADPLLECCGVARDGVEALKQIQLLNPDLVTLDVEMPVMDGLTAVHEIRKINRLLPIVMFSALTERGASATFAALEAGASDYVTKPTQVTGLDDSKRIVETELLPRIKSLARRSLARKVQQPATSSADSASPTNPPMRADRSPSRVDVVALGVSTGGPTALAELMAALPADIGVPVLVVQHMPSMFTKMLAERLDGRSSLAVSEATNGQTLVPGHVYLAPGDWHMRVVRRTNDVVIQLDQGPLVNSCRPSVDVLLESVKTVYGANVLVAIMTGMGSDGADSAALLHQAGAQVIAQDEATSVVWGMPGAIVNRGLADAVVPLDQLASEIVERVGRREDKQPVPSSTPAHLPTHRGAK